MSKLMRKPFSRNTFERALGGNFLQDRARPNYRKSSRYTTWTGASKERQEGDACFVQVGRIVYEAKTWRALYAKVRQKI